MMSLQSKLRSRLESVSSSSSSPPIAVSSPLPALPPKKNRGVTVATVPASVADAGDATIASVSPRPDSVASTVLCGWLRKKGQRRFCIQLDSWLFWFTTEQALIPDANQAREIWFRTARNYLYLPGCVVLQAADDDDHRSIELRTETSSYVLRAETREIAADWLLSLGRSACAPSRRSVLAPTAVPATVFERDVIDRDEVGDDVPPTASAVATLDSGAAVSSSARALRDAALTDALLRLQLSVQPLRAFARYANVHASTSDADIGVLFGCGRDRSSPGSAPRFFVALQHHQLVLFAQSASVSGATPLANVDLLGTRVDYSALAVGMIIVTDMAKNQHILALDDQSAVDDWVVSLRDAAYQHGQRPPSSLGEWLDVEFDDDDKSAAAVAAVAEKADSPAVSRRSLLPNQQHQQQFRGTERLVAGKLTIAGQACFATVNDGAFTWYAADSEVAARARFVSGQTVIGDAPATDFLGCVQMSSAVRVVPILPEAWLNELEKSEPRCRRSVVATRAALQFGFELVAPRYLLAMASGAAAAHVVFVPPKPDAQETDVADAHDEMARVRVVLRDPAQARQWTLALRHARACAPPLGIDVQASVRAAAAPASPTAADDSDDDDDAAAVAAEYDPSAVSTCEGWLLKHGQWRFFRLAGERLLWFERQHAPRLRGKALVSLCSVFAPSDDMLSFVLERDGSWARTLHATSVDDSLTWQAHLVDVVRAAAERHVALYARTAKGARDAVLQRAGWAVLHNQRVWLLLRGGMLIWFASPAPSARARGCLRLARATIAPLSRGAEGAKSGVLQLRTAGSRRLDFHVADAYGEWQHDVSFAVQLATDVASREAALARESGAQQQRSFMRQLQSAIGAASNSSSSSSSSGGGGVARQNSARSNSPPNSGQLSRKERMAAARRTVVLEQHINHSLFPGSKVVGTPSAADADVASSNENEPVRDFYGFVVPPEHEELYEAFLQKFLRSLAEKTALCQQLVESPETSGELDLSSLVLRRGLAPRYRGALWQSFIGADVRVATDPMRFEKLSRAAAAAADSFAHEAPKPHSTHAAVADATHQIELDIGRTFPGLCDDVAFRDSLRAVLYAYAAHNPLVGYTQSMNFIAGVLLVFAPPASVFWMLDYVVTTLMPFTFNDQLVGCFADADVLLLLAEREMPVLTRHCEAIGLQFSMFATQWFMCLFVLSFPAETAFRVWDRVLLLGAGEIFAVALRTLRLAEKKMLSTNDAFDALQVLSATTAALYDADVLFTVKLRFDVDAAWIKLLRSKFRQLRLLS
jgi:hypothetical protein